MSSGSDSEIDENLERLLLQRLGQINDRLLGGDSKVDFQTGQKGTRKRRQNARQATKKISGNETKENKTNTNDVEEVVRKKKIKKKQKEDESQLGVKNRRLQVHREKNDKESLDTETVTEATSDRSKDVKVTVVEEEESRRIDRKKKKRKRGVKKTEKIEGPILARDDDKAGKAGGSKKQKRAVATTSRPTEILDSGGEDLLANDFTDDIEDDEEDIDDEFNDFNEFECGQSDEDYVGQSSGGQAPVGNVQRRLEEFRTKLGLTEQDFIDYRKKHERVQSVEGERQRGRKGGTQKGRPAPEVVVFEDPAKRKKKDPKKTSANPSSQRGVVREGMEFNLFSAKHEVLQFGIQGFDKKTKEEATVDMLVNLGAKKPKNAYVNYKAYMKEKKERAVTESEVAKVSQLQDKHYKGSTAGGSAQKKKRKGGSRGEFVDGQLGTYRQGVQVIGKEDLQKIQATRTSKRRR